MSDVIKRELSKIDSPELREFIRPILERVYTAGQSAGMPELFSSKEVADQIGITEIMVNRIALRLGFEPETKKRFTAEQVDQIKTRNTKRGPHKHI